MNLFYTGLVNVIFSFCGYLLAFRVIPRFTPMLVKAHLYGIDLCKTSEEKIPEATGVIAGSLFLVVMFFFIPVPFTDYLTSHDSEFPHDELVELITALLCICCMLLLGFADDVLDLKWRHKLWLPTAATLPLLMVYYVTFDLTTVIVPKPLRPVLGYDLDLGIIYYVYMGLLSVFLTNAINILAGVNGLEVGQSVVVALSIIIFNLIELSGDCWKAHRFSLYFLVPFFAICVALLRHNWYPSKVFVGDTFCYFAGMTFAVVGILGHFSKTMLLFFVPQVFNFLYSAAQLFRFLPCPRHRIPTYDRRTDRLMMSTACVKKSELSRIGSLVLQIFNKFHLLHMKEFTKDDCVYVEFNNLTLINLVIKFSGPIHERSLTICLLIIQITCSLFAFLVRYQLVKLFY